MAPLEDWSGGCEFDSGGNTDAGGLGDWRRRLSMRRRGGKVRNPGGEPLSFIGAMDARKATVRLDLRACHDSPPRHHMGYVPAIPILSLQRRVGRFASPGGPGLFTSRRDMGQKAFLRPAWAQKFKGQPINGFDDRPKAALRRMMGPRAAKTQAHELQGSLGL